MPADFVRTFAQNLPVLMFGFMYSLAIAGLFYFANRLIKAPVEMGLHAFRGAFLLKCLSLKHMPKSSALKRPSQQSSEVMGKGTDTYKSSALDRLSSADKDGIQRVLDLVGVGFYHTGSLMPEREKLMANRPWRLTQ